MKKRIFIILLILFFGAAFLILSLELLSRKCPHIARRELPDCGYLIKKYTTGRSDSLRNENFMPSPEPNDFELDDVVRKRIIEVEEKDMGSLNGIACGSYGFVSVELPYFAKKYVKDHEAFHLIGYDNEKIVNYKAGSRHPIGLIQTIFYSVFSNFKGRKMTEYPCIIGNLWNTFKVYF